MNEEIKYYVPELDIDGMAGLATSCITPKHMPRMSKEEFSL